MEVISMSDYINELTDLFDALSSFTESMKKATRQDMMLRDPHYNELHNELKNKEKLMEGMLSECSQECSKAVMEYIIDLEDIHHVEGDYFYMRGYSDCLRVMHRLNLLK
jgi:site-specific DNA-adenine methylase